MRVKKKFAVNNLQLAGQDLCLNYVGIYGCGGFGQVRLSRWTIFCEAKSADYSEILKVNGAVSAFVNYFKSTDKHVTYRQ